MAVKWKLVFLGGSVTGTRRAETLWSMLRDDKGKWRELWCPTPSGGQTRMYISKDRNDKQKASEIILKKALVVAKGLHPDLNWTSNRHEVHLEVDWIPALLLEVETARGILGVFVASDGKDSPYRIHLRSPNFNNLWSITKMAAGLKISDLVAIFSTLDIVMPDVDR